MVPKSDLRDNATGTLSIVKRVMRGVTRTSIRVIEGIAIAYCVCRYVVQPISCTGPSMEPTIQSGDMIVVERITAHTRNFQRGDIVVCRSPTDPDSLLCKRVVGLPGDILDNPETGSQIVPKGNVWLLGDNYTNSTDSRHFGFVPIGLLIGRAFFKLNKLQTLS